VSASALDALAGAGVGGVIGWIGTWITAKLTRNREHQYRIWECTTELYEQVLVMTDVWAAVPWIG